MADAVGAAEDEDDATEDEGVAWTE